MGLWDSIGSAVGNIVGNITGVNQMAGAQQEASQLQAQMYGQGIAEQRRQFDELQKLLNPYVQAGGAGLQGYQNLLGLEGQANQRAAIDALQNSPQMAAMIQQGENAMLQNASATGGLRGGNLQGALAQYRPQLLNQMIEQQYSRLGGLAQMGQNSAAGVGSAGMGMASNIGNLMANQGAAMGQGVLAGGARQGQLLGGALGLARLGREAGLF
jgi:hypothetical protein